MSWCYHFIFQVDCMVVLYVQGSLTLFPFVVFKKATNQSKTNIAQSYGSCLKCLSHDVITWKCFSHNCSFVRGIQHWMTESTNDPLQRESNAELWFCTVLFCFHVQVVEETVDMPVIWYIVKLTWHHSDAEWCHVTVIYSTGWAWYLW